MILIEILYLFTVGMLAIYGLNALALALFHQPKTVSDPIDPPQAGFVWPRVTIQLPVFNERYVVERLIDSVSHGGGWGWPHRSMRRLAGGGLLCAAVRR